MSDKDREMLELIAEKMYTRAAEAHAKGMRWATNSARVSQFSYLCSDAEVAEFIRLLIEDGMVEIVNGEPVVNDHDKPSARVDIRITSNGGNS